MSNITILYWEPGSCGDFVQSVLLTRHEEYQGIIENFSIDLQGRVNSRLLDFFKDRLDHEPKKFYFKTWTVDDVELLSTYVSTLNVPGFVIPTHRMDQVDFLQSQFSNCKTVGITYPVNMFHLVLKNWCKKVAAGLEDLEKIYNDPYHQYLKTKNIFGEFILSEQLKFGSQIKSSVNGGFDVAISLEDLYNQNLLSLTLLFQDSSHVQGMFDQWIEKQNIMHRYCYNVPAVLKQALGYNSTAVQLGNMDAELDAFDNILIRHQNRPNSTANFKTLQQASDFFKS